jgi:hypothetical protein
VKAEGLPLVEITTDPENVPSQRVIMANGGVLVEHFIEPAEFGSKPGLRFRILGATDAGHRGDGRAVGQALEPVGQLPGRSRSRADDVALGAMSPRTLVEDARRNL